MSNAPTNEFPFIMTTTPKTKSFSFNISAAGKFYIDWGDGKTETIEKANTGEQTISHSYNNAGAHKIKLGGKATWYDSRYDAAITFYKNLNLAKIDGSLGQIFSTLSDGTQPRFGTPWNWHGTFQGCTNLTGNIPAELFSGIYGAPAERMFHSTFDGCSGLTGSIPENLFAGVSGAPAELMFASTFRDCSNLSGSIPENLFTGVSGTPAEGMFYYTFDGCSNLSGSIPEKLFAGIYGAPANYMFGYTFYGCSGLSGNIPENLFAGIYGAPAGDMFYRTFYGCSGLSGTMDKLGNIKNKKAPSAVTATKKESKPVVQQTETKQTSDTVSTDIKTTVSEQANLDIVDSAKIAQPDVLPTPETKKEQNVKTRKKRRKRHKRSRDVKPQQNSCENLVQGPKFTPVPDMGMTGTISVDIKISGITPDDLAKIIQMACSACNKPNIQITSDIAKHVQQNNLNQR